MEHFERVKRAAHPVGFSLHEQMGPRRAPKGRVVKRTPKAHKPKLALADYVAAQADPPPAVHRADIDYPSWGMLLNDKLGDCGDAMFIHADEAFHLDAGTPVPPYADVDAQTLYTEVSGYDPSQAQPDGSNPTDTGTDNEQLVSYLQSTGLLCAADGQRRKIAATLFVDPGDQRISFIGIWEFVALFSAVALPNTAQGQATWVVSDPTLKGDGAPGSWGYHDIPELSYDGRFRRLVSWGQDMLESEGFVSAYKVQAFVVVMEDQLSLKGVSPAGVNWTALNADLALLPSVPGS